MQGHRNRLVRALLAAPLLAALAAPAFAGTVYSWVTEDGTFAYADDLKRVPNRYRDQVKRTQVGKLQAYPRWTPSKLVVKGDYADRLESNLERLRAVNESLAPMPARRHARRGGAPPSLLVRTSSRGDGIHVPLGGDGPVEVEKIRTKLAGDTATRSMTIIRQGDEVVAVFKGEDGARRIVEVRSDELFERRAIDSDSRR